MEVFYHKKLSKITLFSRHLVIHRSNLDNTYKSKPLNYIKANETTSLEDARLGSSSVGA